MRTRLPVINCYTVSDIPLESVERNVQLVVGPPCAGKSTLVNRLSTPDTLVFDRDDIARRLGSPNKWRHPPEYWQRAEDLMQQAIDHLSTVTSVHAFVVRSAPNRQHRERLAHYLRAEIQLVDPGKAECVRRAIADRRPRETLHWIDRWYALAQ